MHVERDHLQIQSRLAEIFGNEIPATLTPKGSEIQRLRSERGIPGVSKNITQEHLARITGVGQERLSKIERGKTKKVETAALYVIAVAFGVELHDVAEMSMSLRLTSSLPMIRQTCPSIAAVDLRFGFLLGYELAFLDFMQRFSFTDPRLQQRAQTSLTQALKLVTMDPDAALLRLDAKTLCEDVSLFYFVKSPEKFAALCIAMCAVRSCFAKYAVERMGFAPESSEANEFQLFARAALQNTSKRFIPDHDRLLDVLSNLSSLQDCLQALTEA